MRFIRLLALWIIVVAAIFATADAATASIDTATLIALIWGIVSAFAFKVVPATGLPMVLLTYLAPLIVCVLAVLIVGGTASWNWQRFLIDVFVAYGANQAVFQAARHTIPTAVT